MSSSIATATVVLVVVASDNRTVDEQGNKLGGSKEGEKVNRWELPGGFRAGPRGVTGGGDIARRKGAGCLVRTLGGACGCSRVERRKGEGGN